MDALALLSRRIELEEVRRADPGLPGVVGFKGELLIDASLKAGELRLQIVGLRHQPSGLQLLSGAPDAESIRVPDPELGERVRLFAENPARALRVLARQPVKNALLRLSDARIELDGPTLTVRAKAQDAEAGVPIAAAAIALMTALADGCREDDLATATRREHARRQSPPSEPARRFVAVSAASGVGEDKLDELRRLARALVHWRSRASEMREHLIHRGATGALADELLAEFLPVRRAELRFEFALHALGSAALFTSGAYLMSTLPRSPLPLWLLIGGTAVLIRGIFRYMTRLH